MKPLATIRMKLFFSFLLFILISYSGLIYITFNSIDSCHGVATDFSLPISLTSKDLASVREKNLDTILIFTVFGTIVSFAIAYIVAKRLTTPVRELTQGARRIEVGDFSYRVKIDSGDEFGVLASSLNRMAEALNERETTIKKKSLDMNVLNRSLQELNEQLEEKVAERTAALEVEKGRLEAVLTCMAEGVLVTDQANRIILFNPAAQRILELPTSRALGTGLEQVCTVGGFCQLLDLLREMQRVGYLPEGRENYLETKGKKLKVNMSPLLDKRWDFAGVVMSIRDVTIEEEIDRMKTEFISTVSHELKTPLTSIKGSLQIILRRESQLTETERELLSVCQRNTDRLMRLISDILDISRIESGKIEFNLKPESISRLISEAVEEMAAFAAQRNISIVNSTGTQLPPVLADHDRLIQVITNLVSNAVKFSPSDDVVYISAESRGGFVGVSVADNAKPIKKMDRDKLFKKFQKLDGNAEHAGTGLGLSICKEIVERHHGRIYYRSRTGRGNIFTFTIPVYEVFNEKREDTNR